MNSEDVNDPFKPRVEDPPDKDCPLQESHFGENPEAAVNQLITEELLELFQESLNVILGASYYNAQAASGQTFITVWPNDVGSTT